VRELVFQGMNLPAKREHRAAHNCTGECHASLIRTIPRRWVWTRYQRITAEARSFTPRTKPDAGASDPQSAQMMPLPDKGRLPGHWAMVLFHPLQFSQLGSTVFSQLRATGFAPRGEATAFISGMSTPNFPTRNLTMRLAAAPSPNGFSWEVICR